MVEMTYIVTRKSVSTWDESMSGSGIIVWTLLRGVMVAAGLIIRYNFPRVFGYSQIGYVVSWME